MIHKPQKQVHCNLLMKRKILHRASVREFLATSKQLVLPLRLSHLGEMYCAGKKMTIPKRTLLHLRLTFLLRQLAAILIHLRHRIASISRSTSLKIRDGLMLLNLFQILEMCRLLKIYQSLAQFKQILRMNFTINTINFQLYLVHVASHRRPHREMFKFLKQ